MFPTFKMEEESFATVPSLVDSFFEEEEDKFCITQDRFLGQSPRPVDKPPRVAFVGSTATNPNLAFECYNNAETEEGNYFGFNATSTHYQPVNDYNVNFEQQIEGANLISSSSWLEQNRNLSSELDNWFAEPLNFNNSFEGDFLDLVEGANNAESAPQDEQAIQKRDEILQEIVRECEQLENLQHRTEITETPPNHAHPPEVVGDFFSQNCLDYSSSYFSSPSSGNESGNEVAEMAQEEYFGYSSSPCTTPGALQSPLAEIGTKAKSAAYKSPAKSSRKMGKREKKKAQNRQAATRYRQKKSEERNSLSKEEAVLEARNKELKSQVEDALYEIRYLKQLMREVSAASSSKSAASSSQPPQ